MATERQPNSPLWHRPPSRGVGSAFAPRPGALRRLLIVCVLMSAQRGLFGHRHNEPGQAGIRTYWASARRRIPPARDRIPSEHPTFVPISTVIALVATPNIGRRQLVWLLACRTRVNPWIPLGCPPQGRAWASKLRTIIVVHRCTPLHGTLTRPHIQQHTWHRKKSANTRIFLGHTLVA